MSLIFTLGFTKKTACQFFELLKKNQVKKLIDVRLNNSSQLAGFTKGENLKYFLKEIADIEYVHELVFAPTKEILDAYKKGNLSWSDYEIAYEHLMIKRNIKLYIEKKGKEYWENSCLLCSEETAEQCHRRLAAEKIIFSFPELKEKDL